MVEAHNYLFVELELLDPGGFGSIRIDMDIIPLNEGEILAVA